MHVFKTHDNHMSIFLHKGMLVWTVTDPGSPILLVYDICVWTKRLKKEKIEAFLTHSKRIDQTCVMITVNKMFVFERTVTSCHWVVPWISISSVLWPNIGWWEMYCCALVSCPILAHSIRNFEINSSPTGRRRCTREGSHSQMTSTSLTCWWIMLQ